MAEDSGTDLVPVDVQQKVVTGSIVKWADLTKAVARPAEPVRVDIIPVPTALAEDEVAAIKRLPEVYGQVVPSEVRAVTPAEVTDLLIERATLKTVEKAMARRLDDIALTLLNHSDVLTDEGDPGDPLLDPAGEPLRNKDGHIVTKRKVRGDDPTVGSHFSIEARKGSISVDMARFKALADDHEVDYISHEDYLAMSTQVRVFDENKAMLHLRKNPELLRAVREIASTGTAVVSVYQRDDK